MRLAEALKALYELLGGNDMTAYLAMMAPRLVELRRVLKPTGIIYLHCDPTASHYLKILMDGIFGAPSFLNEIMTTIDAAQKLARRTEQHRRAEKGFTARYKVRKLVFSRFSRTSGTP